MEERQWRDTELITTHTVCGLLYFCQVLSGLQEHRRRLKLLHSLSLWHRSPRWTAGGRVAESEQNSGTKSRKFYFSFKYSCSFSISSQKRCTQEGYNVASVSGSLWYSTLRWKTSQTVLAHHCSNYQQQECPFISITPFFLCFFLFFSSVPFFCLACALISARGSFTSTHPRHFSSNLLSQQSYFFFFLLPPSQYCVVLHWTTATHTKELLTLLWARLGFGQKSKWEHIGLWRWSDWQRSDDSIQTITKTLQSTRGLPHLRISGSL